MNPLYIIENEAIKPNETAPLTIARFMARFFNSIFCAD